MSNSPFISIIVPTYNRAALIAATLRSLQTQDYDNYEIIIVDDGSTDNTEEVVKAIADSRTTYFRKDNAERAAARNYGADKARGDYVNFFDSDDLAYPNHMATAAALIVERSNPEWFHLGVGFVDVNGKQTKAATCFKKTTLNKLLLNGNVLGTGGVFVRRDIIQKIRFNEDRALSTSEDYELWLRLAARYPLYHSNTTTSVLVEHEARSVHDINGDSFIKRLELVLFYALQDDAVTSYYKNELSRIKIEVNTYLALHLAELPGYKAKSIKYLCRAVMNSPLVFMRKRFFVIIRNLILR